jgi:hypothetical protein
MFVCYKGLLERETAVHNYTVYYAKRQYDIFYARIFVIQKIIKINKQVFFFYANIEIAGLFSKSG